MRLGDSCIWLLNTRFIEIDFDVDLILSLFYFFPEEGNGLVDLLCGLWEFFRTDFGVNWIGYFF